MSNDDDLVCGNCEALGSEHLCPQTVNVAAPKTFQPSIVSSGEMVRALRESMAAATDQAEQEEPMSRRAAHWQGASNALYLILEWYRRETEKRSNATEMSCSETATGSNGKET